MRHSFLHLALLGLASASLLTACAEDSSTSDEDVQTEANGTRIIRPRTGALTAPSSAPRVEIVRDFLKARGVASDSVGVTHESVGAGGVTHLQLAQTIDGLRVHDAYVKAAIDQNGQLLQLIERVAPVTGVLAKPAFDERAALGVALGHLNYDDATPAKVSGQGNKTKFAKGSTFHREPEVERVAYLDGAVVRAGFLVETWSDVGNQLDYTLVGAAGAVVSSERRTNNSDSYNVYLENPSKGAQTPVNGPAPGGALSPNGWLGTGTQNTINILGNNVNAYLDAKSNNAPDTGGTVVANGQFLTTHIATDAPSTAGNRAVAVQNLFYLNNVVHDRLYQIGFTESERNFQETNFPDGGAGGLGSDSVNAEAQDGSGTDNANFATPADGSNPRMQMFLWNSSAPNSSVTVLNESPLGAYQSSFGPALTETGVVGPLKNYVNAGGGTDACVASAVSLTGTIALVDRGNCDFVLKVTNAYKAGAKGVIIANHVGGTTAFAPGGSGRVRIPSVMVSQNAGVALRGRAGASTKLSKDPTPRLMIDADLDSDIVFHEYGHGLTWRMIGGMSGPIAGAIGEGASDVLAFLIDGDDKMAEYSAGGVGIRRFPYVNYPLTLAAVTGAEVHDDGEIYAAAMWKLFELVRGTDTTVAGAEAAAQTVLALFVDGMKGTPATPTFQMMRDGMLLSSSTLDCKIWQAFAAFGIGAGSSMTQTTTTSVTVVESFTVPAGVCP